jgi:hypothetical protein
MNATNFFTEETYNRIKADIKAEKILDYSLGNNYEKEIKVNGNKYKLSIHTGRYTYEGAKGQYYVSLWHDYNYANPPFSRSIGGGGGTRLNLETYETFKESINNTLKQFPDYTEEEPPLQFAIVF